MSDSEAVQADYNVPFSANDLKELFQNNKTKDGFTTWLYNEQGKRVMKAIFCTLEDQDVDGIYQKYDGGQEQFDVQAEATKQKANMEKFRDKQISDQEVVSLYQDISLGVLSCILAKNTTSLDMFEYCSHAFFGSRARYECGAGATYKDQAKTVEEKLNSKDKRDEGAKEWFGYLRSIYSLWKQNIESQDYVKLDDLVDQDIFFGLGVLQKAVRQLQHSKRIYCVLQ